MVSDFAHLNNDGLVTRALSRLEKEGVLIRLSQGLYLYPLQNKFGVLRPSIEDIAYAIAEKDKARIIPSGLTALNKLGLSTQQGNLLSGTVKSYSSAAHLAILPTRQTCFHL